jgi:hypothetical protein
MFDFCLIDGLVRKRSQMLLPQSRSMGEFRILKKSSSCSTIYIDDSTVSNPNLKNTIKCVSLAIYYLIKHRKANVHLEIFDEKIHPLTVSSALTVTCACPCIIFLTAAGCPRRDFYTPTPLKNGNRLLYCVSKKFNIRRQNSHQKAAKLSP